MPKVEKEETNFDNPDTSSYQYYLAFLKNAQTPLDFDEVKLVSTQILEFRLEILRAIVRPTDRNIEEIRWIEDELAQR